MVSGQWLARTEGAYRYEAVLRFIAELRSNFISLAVGVSRSAKQTCQWSVVSGRWLVVSGQWLVHIFAKRKYIEIYEVNYIERPKVLLRSNKVLRSRFLYRISHSEVYRVRSTFRWSVVVSC